MEAEGESTGSEKEAADQCRKPQAVERIRTLRFVSEGRLYPLVVKS